MRRKAQEVSATPGMVTVSVNPAGLPAGTYNGTVLITAAGAANSPLRIPVTLVVRRSCGCEDA